MNTRRLKTRSGFELGDRVLGEQESARISLGLVVAAADNGTTVLPVVVVVGSLGLTLCRRPLAAIALIGPVPRYRVTVTRLPTESVVGAGWCGGCAPGQPS